jgi:homoserine O-acetyltransferase/O-succinyltransferase
MLALLAAALAVSEGDFVVREFRFASGEMLPELRLHYRTLGTPGSPAVLVLHGTTGSGAQFLGDSFAGALFGPGQLLDAARHFIVLPDGIGHGGSSKPSDGLHARFPRYGYGDMVEAQRRLLVEKLGISHLRLIVGTSMGCMHSWLWAEAQPKFMDAVLALACLPVQIAGRNRALRKLAADAIRQDPAWNGGEYRQPPLAGLRGALEVLFFMGSAAAQLQSQAGSRDAADRFAEEWMAKRLATTDATDFLYAFEASRDYDPSAGLEKIEAAVTAINSADDEVNPPELGILEREIRRVRRGKAVVLPIGPQTRGHGTHTNAPAWKDHLAELLQRSSQRP